MPKIVVGLSRKRPGSEQYSSDGWSVTVELDVEIGSPEEFANTAKALFAEVEAALDTETGERKPAPKRRADLWTGGNGRRPSRAQGETNRGNGGGSQAEPISNKQAAYLTQLLARQGITQQGDVAKWLTDSLGVVVSTQYELDKPSASRAIEALKDKAANGK